MPIPESDVLKPTNPALDEVKWAEFVLSDASIVYESNGKPASLLSAYEDTALKVQGRLKTPPRDYSHYLLKKPYKPTDIVIRNVTRYSYAQMTDGTYVVWALGKAGWFEIQPAAHYQTIYDDMIQAVQVLYFVIDIYSKRGRKGYGPTAGAIYQMYAEDDRFPCNDPDEAKQIFSKHRDFLLVSFRERVHDIVWSSTSLYKTLRSQFRKEFEARESQQNGRFTNTKPERISPVKEASPAPATTGKSTSGKWQSGKSKTTTRKVDELPRKDENWWKAATLFEFIQKAVNQRIVRAGRNSITVDRVAQLVIKRYEIDDVETARNVLFIHAQNLCYMMDHPRRQNIRFFATEPIYDELTAKHSLSEAQQRKAEGIELRPRRDHRTLRDEDSETSDTSDEEDEPMLTPVRRMSGRSKKGTLSVLRPKSGKYSGKGKSVNGGGKGKTILSTSVSDSDSASDEEDVLAIDIPTHAFSSGPSKRKLNTSDETTKEGKRKRTLSSTTPSSPLTSADEITQPGTGDPLPPLLYRPSNKEPTSKSTKPLLPTLVSTFLPTYESNGPRDSWICSFDGCAQRIYGCSGEIGQQLIVEHLEDHTKGREKAVGILWREQDKLHLPVNNLIKKIREMSEAKTPLFPNISGTSTAQLQPIHRPV